MRVYRSADLTPRQFPCAVVRAKLNQRMSGEVFAANRMLVSVFVMTEYAPMVDAQAGTVQEFEEREEDAVSAALDALYVDDLATQLNAQDVSGVTISYAVPGDGSGNPVTSESSEENNVSIVEIPLIVHAGAREET
jgi:hypothetical protein